MSVTVAVTLKELPKSCDSCPFYSERPYTCHNERGDEAHCALGYFRGTDMRDCSYRKGRRAGELHFNCRLKDNLI